MTDNMQLMDIIRLNIDDHHAKLSDALYNKWIVYQKQGKIENKSNAFNLNVVIGLKESISEYLSQSSLNTRWEGTSEEDKNGICSVLLMDFLIELAHTFQKNFKSQSDRIKISD